MDGRWRMAAPTTIPRMDRGIELDNEILAFLCVEAVWWNLDTILEAYHDVDEDKLRATLDRLLTRGLIYRDNQNPPWYAAVEQSC